MFYTLAGINIRLKLAIMTALISLYHIKGTATTGLLNGHNKSQRLDKEEIMIAGRCKAKDLKREITFAWYGIGKVWVLDETDIELIGRN